MTINKDSIDQPLHVLAGAVIVVGFSFITSLWMAALISAMTGLVREIYQRYDQDRAWYDFMPHQMIISEWLVVVYPQLK